MVPYGYYIRAMFWNKKLFKQAGLYGTAEDDRRVRGDANKISALGDGKSGYCLRGGAGRLRRHPDLHGHL